MKNARIQVRSTTALRLLAGSLCALVPFVAAAPALASGTRAGTTINNTATATYDNGNGGTASVNSNTVSLRVDEILDVTVAARTTGDVSTGAGKTGQVQAFTVTNTGNGPEAFRLDGIGAVAGDDFDLTVTDLAIDVNGNGTYEPGVDTLLSNGAASTVLDPDASIAVLVISTVPAAATDGQRGKVQLKATATTGSGAPGTAFPGQGVNGGDAIVGATRALADAAGTFIVSVASVGFVKSATVADPYGGSRSVPGSTVTWRLVASVTGSGTVAGLKASDAIPAGTTYLPGTLTLDGSALSDAADADAGSASSGGIAVTLGTLAAGSSKAIEFKTKIN